jgi:hypothetical protein
MLQTLELWHILSLIPTEFEEVQKLIKYTYSTIQGSFIQPPIQINI